MAKLRQLTRSCQSGDELLDVDGQCAPHPFKAQHLPHRDMGLLAFRGVRSWDGLARAVPTQRATPKVPRQRQPQGSRPRGELAPEQCGAGAPSEGWHWPAP